MANRILSVSELLEIYINEVESNTTELTDFTEGSIQDIEAGATSTAVHEAMTLAVELFKKTMFKSAEGPEATGGPDDLEDLAVDHFGDTFARPEAQKAIGIETFTRPNTAAGDVLIQAGTIVKTEQDSSGEVQRFETIADVLMVGTSINASIRAVTAGPKGNVSDGLIKILETTLTDPTIVCTNNDETTGGAVVMNDSDYRQYIVNLIESIRGATKAAIEAKAKTVSGVVSATIVEIEKVVIEWDIANEVPIGDYFRIPYATLYIADANGTANAALINAVKAAIELVRAAGVRINVVGATAFTLNWTAEITLNPSGPNYTALSNDPQPILDTMRDYINAILPGSGFDVSDAEAAILAIWGPSGTDDLVSGGFDTVIPSGNVAGVPGTKIIAGTMAIGSC